MTYAHELSAALAAAQHAGDMALAYQGKHIDIQQKNGLRDSPVTDADTAVDAYLRETLTRAFPHDAWLSEETADDHSRLKHARCWVVDPIDGTTGYISWLHHGMPSEPEHQNRRQFAVSIALLDDGMPILGVVYAPLRNQMMHAVRGQGVFLNTHKIERADDISTLAEAVYLSSISEERDGLLDFLQGQTRFQAYSSVAYKMALTALTSNSVTASVKPKNLWDVAAGEVMCREMGLNVTDLAGKSIDYTGACTHLDGLIVAPDGLYEQLIAVLPDAPTGGYR